MLTGELIEKPDTLKVLYWGGMLLEPDLAIKHGKKWYELFQKGKAKVDECYGYADVYQWEMVSYYEYENIKNEKELFTIEQWNDGIECSVGKYVSPDKITVM